MKKSVHDVPSSDAAYAYEVLLNYLADQKLWTDKEYTINTSAFTGI